MKNGDISIPDFPEWAPASLVFQFERLQLQAFAYRLVNVEEEKKNDPEFLSRSLLAGVDWSVEPARTEKLADTLARLLTDPDMKIVWAELSRPAVVAAPYKQKHAYMIWATIVSALNDFPGLVARARTPAQKAKNLKSVRAKAQLLLDEINTDPTTAEMARLLLAKYLTTQNYKYRKDRGERPAFEESWMPMNLFYDYDEAMKVGMEKGIVKGRFRWSKRPLISRLIYWTAEVIKINLTDLLGYLIAQLQIEEKYPPEIKQPGRAESAIKAFLVRRLSDHMEWYYGQPLDEAVARIVSLVLDLPTPLTRDDVRPYTKQTGKYMPRG